MNSDKNLLNLRIEKVDKLFRYGHLPQHLQDISRPFHDLAFEITHKIPNTAEYTLFLRSLWEAKNLAVYAAVELHDK